MYSNYILYSFTVYFIKNHTKGQPMKEHWHNLCKKVYNYRRKLRRRSPLRPRYDKARPVPEKLGVLHFMQRLSKLRRIFLHRQKTFFTHIFSA